VIRAAYRRKHHDGSRVERGRASCRLHDIHGPTLPGLWRALRMERPRSPAALAVDTGLQRGKPPGYASHHTRTPTPPTTIEGRDTPWRIAWLPRPALICCSTRRIRSTGIRGGQRPSRPPVPKTSPCF